MRHEVTDIDTATAVGSGDVPVLATPRLLAWMEAATVAAAEDLLEPGQTTVGTAVRIEHLRATGVGDSVDVVADQVGATESGRITFSVSATDSTGSVVASGEVDRVVVDRDRFLTRMRRVDRG